MSPASSLPARAEQPRQPAGAGPGQDRPRGISRDAVAGWLERDALYIAALAAVVVLGLAGAASHLSQDGWLSLVSGRLIAAHGIPSHDPFTVLGAHTRWVDQQWLAQLASYGLERLGGLQLYVIADVGLTGIALALAIAAARAFGGRERQVIYVLPVATFFFMVTAVSIRTQAFAYPLFVGVLWLLASDLRSPSRRRVYAVLPLLVLWANLHGSVTVGAGMAVLYGLCRLRPAVAAAGVRGALTDRRGIVFVLVPPLTLLATPYGASVLSYYHATLLNPQFAKLVSEWRPVTSLMLLAVPFLLFAGATVYLLGRNAAHSPLFDRVALAVLAFGGILAVRNITWFGLAALVLLPGATTRGASTLREIPRRTRLNTWIGGTAVGLVALTLLATALHRTAWFERTYDPRTVATVDGIVAGDPGAKIFADVRFADWLIWHDPALAGRIAYDTSLELLPIARLADISNLTQQRAPGSPDLLGPYHVLVLDPTDTATDRILLARPGIHVVRRTKRVIVATQPARSP